MEQQTLISDLANVNTTPWSSLQEDIFTEVVDGSGNIVVIARAGTGKTTTIVEAVVRYAKRFPKHRVIVCAFNKSIADELSARFLALGARNVEAKTLHSLGYACVREAWPGVSVQRDDAKIRRADVLTEQVTNGAVPNDIFRLVSKLHTLGRDMAPHAREGKELEAIALQFECEPDETWAASGFTLAWICDKAAAAMEVAATNRALAKMHGIDYADMMFLPVRNHWMQKLYNLVVVDEGQDMTVTQLELAMGVVRGRAMVVGDNRQAIYGFRGADSESLSRLKAELGAVELPLNITYRCAKAIVREAQRLVPDFRAGENNPEGQVIDLDYSKLTETAAEGDFILSRVNAPLVTIAMSLLRQGKRARVKGKDIGTGLLSIIKKLAKGSAAQSIPALIDRIQTWQDREVERWTRAQKDAKVQLVKDQAEMLLDLSTSSKSVRELQEKIEVLFTDRGLGTKDVITCSSVHKAKGLEADRVFVLRSTLYRFGVTPEEENIEYVAITRAKSTLVWVQG